jgi:hypothetical protein
LFPDIPNLIVFNMENCMSRTAFVLKQIESQMLSDASGIAETELSVDGGRWDELIERVFGGLEPVRVAAFAAVDSGRAVKHVVDGVASALTFGNERRVLVVDGWSLLSIPSEESLNSTPFIRTDDTAGVWSWPGNRTTRHRPCNGGRERHFLSAWMDRMRRDFDYVLVECPPVDAESGTVVPAILAERVVLVVSDTKPRNEITLVQNVLEIRGARVAGCVLYRQKPVPRWLGTLLGGGSGR